MDQKTIKHQKSALIIHAKALGIPSGSAQIFIDKAVLASTKKLEKQTITTDADIVRTLAKELKKYNPDLAYVYENYAKII